MRKMKKVVSLLIDFDILKKIDLLAFEKGVTRYVIISNIIADYFGGDYEKV